LVDRVLQDYQSLRSSARLGAVDKQKLDMHLTLLQETQQRVNIIAGNCSQMRPASNLSDRKVILRTMNDVMVALMACGLCHTFLGWAQAIISPNDPESYHNWSHAGYDNDTDTIADQTAYNNLVAHNRSILNDMCLDLALKMDAVGILDDSVIAYIQEHNKRGHESWNVPIITIGSGGGNLKTGQFIDYRDTVSRSDQVFSSIGFPINQALANILTSIGVPAAEYEALNKAGYTHSGFKTNSGYSNSKIHPDAASLFGGHYGRSGWAGHDLSSWLPLVR
jgi:hypothetical protein